jgi:hypothetical protein
MTAALVTLLLLLAAPPSRELALQALSSARSAVSQASANAAGRERAAAKLAEAEQLFQSERYEDAARAADAAWQLLAQKGSAPSRFAVEVENDGKTRVRVKEGDAVRVEAAGKARSVHAGERLVVAKGDTPPAPVPDVGTELKAPELLKPAADAKVSLEKSGAGQGALHVSWQPVDGAVAYKVEAVPARGGRGVVLQVKKPEAALLGLALGAYRWHVTALGEDGAEARSQERSFELMTNSLKLDVRESSWK